MNISRIWAMPSADTFDVGPIHSFVWKYLCDAKVSVDPFARNRGWATYTNDLNPETTAQHHLEAAEFLRMLLAKGVSADLIIFDPPYSLRQCSEVYKSVGRPVTMQDTQIFGKWTEHKSLCDQLLNAGGVFLHFGWHTNGIGLKYGFEIEEVVLVAHGGAHNDTICTAEKRTRQSLFSQAATEFPAKPCADAATPGVGGSEETDTV